MIPAIACFQQAPEWREQRAVTACMLRETQAKMREAGGGPQEQCPAKRAEVFANEVKGEVHGITRYGAEAGG